jgi:hypothetical protein
MLRLVDKFTYDISSEFWKTLDKICPKMYDHKPHHKQWESSDFVDFEFLAGKGELLDTVIIKLSDRR